MDVSVCVNSRAAAAEIVTAALTLTERGNEDERENHGVS